MAEHRIAELLALLKPYWQHFPDLNLAEIMAQLANEAGFQGSLIDVSDDMLIYQLKMRQEKREAMIPGLAKDCEPDFKTAILQARGIIK
ncbi:YihD family protein [Photobacterium sp. WH77]|uniref:YihD family protein n=1 Tax=unclassified Photobacterium TaxID=2628852 RepID=UPI001EDC2D8D|nr:MULTISPECIES: YihD family protein [unclassified Photobacterium]MCG2839233.1 YihD family protein [Photobacterium sp. WH77]MCG2846864.1 YihD family protein [Photobacterium sp. WH80]MDO6582896.1 YihD family protein [Photobacterium sp. 2_MG-2023]